MPGADICSLRRSARRTPTPSARRGAVRAQAEPIAGMALKLVHVTGMVGFSLLCLTNMDKVWKKADGYIKEIVRACPVV